MTKNLFDAVKVNEIRQEYRKLIQNKKIASRYDIKNFIESYQTSMKGGLN